MTPARHFPAAALLAAATLVSQSALAQPGVKPEQLVVSPAQIERAGVKTAPALATVGGGDAGSGALVLTGTVVAPSTAQSVSSSNWSGVIQELKAAPLQTVRAGAPLAVLYSQPWMALQADYLGQAAQARLASDRLARDEGLYKDGIIARVRLDESRAAAQAATLGAEQQVHALRAGGMSAAQIRALVDSRQVTPLLTVRAQAAGTILDMPLAAGQQVEPGMAVARIVRPGPLWVELQASRQQLPSIAIGDTLLVGEGCSVRVTAISPLLNDANQTATVRAEQRERNDCLRVNAFVEARLLHAARQDGAVAVPAGALARRGAATYVFVRNAKGFLAVPVQPGAAAGEHVWVRGAVAAGAPVAARGVAALKGVWSGLGEPAQEEKGQP
ncbi:MULTISPECIES: efflux RND transporter periplasmic adaptor subunit [Massilia]|uniref:HlyD secretion family protein n=1 Tax=Massilia timonae TaxID=47229 RepID=A0A1S2N3D3_9BURK|nr:MULTISPECIES: efflux RND transporter periplasmic adaptor subunit [Massilia]OIJ39595.1 hlyD secretion family protein [Massilia timonae]